MATGTAFKQQCPSCEALVPVKDVSMVGKKIECPKCKDKFTVKSPETKKADSGIAPKPPAKTTPKKPAPARAPEATDKNGKAAIKEADGTGKRKAAGNRFTMVIAVAVVGVLMLGAAGYFILFSKSGTPTPSKGKKTTARAMTSPSRVVKNTAKTSKGKTSKGTTETKKIAPEPAKNPQPMPVVSDVPVKPANPVELTNLLPNDTQHVAHVPMGAVLDPAGAIAGAMFQTPGALKDEYLRAKLGFSVLAIDDLLRAQRYGANGWTFTVVHFREIVNEDAVKKALALKPAPLVKGFARYEIGSFNPWMDRLARFAVGVPRSARSASSGARRPLFVHFHDPQTLIFADEAPLVALFNQDMHFKATTDAAGAAKAAVPQEVYGTIKPALKAMLLQMENLKADFKGRVLYSSATDMDAARLPETSGALKSKALWYPRLIWDATILLEDNNPRIRTLGVAIAKKSDRAFQMRNLLDCPLDNDARVIQKDLEETGAPAIAHFVERLLGNKVELPKKNEDLIVGPTNSGRYGRGSRYHRGPGYGKGPLLPAKEKKVDKANISKITLTQNDKSVDLTLDLNLDTQELSKLHAFAGLIGADLGAAMQVAGRVWSRHDLARAGKLLPEKGLTEPDVHPGYYPPGAFPLPANRDQLSGRYPMERISWMAGLLPFLGQDALYNKIHFGSSWRDPSNWGPASTLVPEFIDPSYPVRTYYVPRIDLPFDMAATHFVGIAGIGLDAADYDPADPAMGPKRGVMGYDKGMSLEEVRKGHGLGNTILMVQVPPDSIVGVTPWIAGGGGTLRGVPEKNSVAPFVFSSTDKDNNTRRGTYALMADGSVRFIDADVSDEVFKALATAGQPLPPGFTPDAADSKTPLVPAPTTTSTGKRK